MDSTLFDYKNTFHNDASRTLPKNNGKGQRPISAQNQKLSSYTVSPNNYGDQQGNQMPQIGANRARPITAANKTGYGNQNEPSRNIPHHIIEELEAEEEARLVEKVAYGEGMQIQDVQKLMPRNIHVEKEKLYEDTLHLKQHINILKEENLRLKTKNLNLERENIKMVKAMEKMGSYTTQYGKQPESALIVALKKQVKEMKEELKMRVEELEVMKRSTKFTKVQELEIELKVYMDENIRLKNSFEELQKAKPEIKLEDYQQLEERFYMQANLIESLQRDHARLSADMKYLEEENYNFQVAKETDAKNAQNLKQEINRLKKQIKDKEHKASLAYKNDGMRPYGKLDDKSKSDAEPSDVRRVQEQKDQIIAQKDKTIEDLRQKLNNKTFSDTQKSQSNEVTKIKEQYAELESKYRALLNIHYPGDDKKKGNEGRPSTKPDEENTNESEFRGKKSKKVAFEEVSEIGYELSLKLKVRDVPLESVLKSFERHGSKISVADMKNILAQDPFKIKDEGKALLVARFLVEPQDDIAFDIHRTQDISSVKNTFRKLVGNYTLWDQDEAQEIGDDLGEIILQYEETLQAQLMMMPEAKTGYLSADRIREAFDLLEIELNDKYFEYLIMNLYEYTGNLKRLDFMKMFEIFENEEHKKAKKLIESYQNQNELDSERSDRKVKFKDNKGYANRPQSAGHHKQRHHKDDEEEDFEAENQFIQEGDEDDDDEYDEEYEEDEDHAKR